MKKQIGLLAIIALIVSFMAFSGVASAQASNVQVVFFEQPGCSACAAALPIVQSAAAKYGVTLTVYNTLDESQGKGLAAANGVSVTPTIIVSGAQAARFEGSVTQAQMEAAIVAAIGTTTPTATPTATPTPVVKAVATTKPVATVKAVATTKPVATVKAVAIKTDTKTVVKTSKQPTIVVATATQTPTTTTQTVPEFSLLGLGAPALVVAAIYLFLRRR